MVDAATLPRTIALAKNARGVAVYDPDQPPDREVFTWLARRHQYRNVGFAPGLFDAHPSVDLDGYKTFVELPLPFESLEPLVDALATDAPRWAVESLAVASTYAAPLFVHRPALGALDPLAVWRLRAAPDLPGDQVLRHMRIAGYGTLDFHADAATRAHEAALEGDLDAEQERRVTAAGDDGGERFWRLLDQAEFAGDDPVGGYYDLLPAIGSDAVSVIDGTPETAVALGLVGAMAIDPPY